MRPVLIGSEALKFYGLVDKSNDIDLLVNQSLAGELALACDKKEGPMIWFGDRKLDLIQVQEKSTNQQIFELCNQYAKAKAKAVVEIHQLDGIGEVIVPPLQFLYAIYKSHIHRILPLTPYQRNNIIIWRNAVNKYLQIRERCGYEKMDTIIYGFAKTYSDVLPNQPLPNESGLDYQTRKIFLERFEETNQKYGDTQLSMDKAETEFFEDQVEFLRVIPHDDLHGKVGLMCRQDPNPLFRKYQKNPETVELDRETFIQATLKEQLDIIHEELMVLLLERKWIPELVNCYQKLGIFYTGYDAKKKAEELMEIIAHFITNLCGQGHYFLRRFCLDHYQMISSIPLFDFDSMEELACEITKIDRSVVTGSAISLLDQIKADSGENKKHFTDFLKCKDFDESWFDDTDLVFGQNESEYFECQCITLDKQFLKIKIGKRFIRPVAAFWNLFQKKDRVILLDSTANCLTLYNINKNVGLKYNSDRSWYVFTCQIKAETITKTKSSSRKKDFVVNGTYCRIDEKLKTQDSLTSFQQSYEKRVIIYYYYSEGYDCGWKQKGEIADQGKYLSSYGSLKEIDFMGCIFELLARKFLNVEYDQRHDDYDCESEQSCSEDSS